MVDDFEPWRHFVSSMLLIKPELQVVGEASDGLEAVQKAVELKPDLILLDISLPKLNGIEAARRIRKLAPESKIIFVSQESSADVVQEALSLGTAVEAVLLGTFVSSTDKLGFHRGARSDILLGTVSSQLRGRPFTFLSTARK